MFEKLKHCKVLFSWDGSVQQIVLVLSDFEVELVQSLINIFTNYSDSAWLRGDNITSLIVTCGSLD